MPPVLGPAALPIHDIVTADALACGYRTLAALVAERGKSWQDEHGGPLMVLSEGDPMLAAIVHLADALTRLQQGVREQAPRARQHYEAVLIIAGHMAREVPLGSFRRPPGQGRAA